MTCIMQQAVIQAQRMPSIDYSKFKDITTHSKLATTLVQLMTTFQGLIESRSQYQGQDVKTEKVEGGGIVMTPAAEVQY